MTAGHDRRAHYRLAFHCEAQIEGLDLGRLSCRIADISVGGAFVEASTVLPVGARTSVRFALLGHEITTAAEVRYSTPGIGMGLRFVNLSELGEVVIRTLIARETAERRKRERNGG